MTNSELQDILLLLQKDTNKIILMKKIASLEAKRLNISAPSVALFSDNDTKHLGKYNRKKDILYVNKKYKIESYNEYLRFLETIIHETRHKYQFSAIKSPNVHLEVRDNIKDYLEDAAKNYPKKDDPDYEEKYSKNALEHDTKTFGKSRALYYGDYSWSEIFSLKEAPRRQVKNQILMDPGDDGANTQIAPPVVKELYYSNAVDKMKISSNTEQKMKISNSIFEDNQLNTSSRKKTAHEEFCQKLRVDVKPIVIEKKNYNNTESPSVSAREKVLGRQTGFDRDDDFACAGETVGFRKKIMDNNAYMEESMSYKMDFTDRNITQVYLEMSEEVNNAYQAFIESTRNICTMHAYKPMVDFTNAMQEKYFGEFKECILRLYEEWRNGESSLEALARRTGSGEEAVQTARSYMDELENNLLSMFSQGYDAIQVDLAAPALTEQDILKLNTEISGFLQRVENAKVNAEQICNGRSEENVLYSLIKPVLSSTGNTLDEWMKDNMNQVIEGSQLYAQGVAAVANNLSMPSTTAPGKVDWGNVDSFM